MAPRSSSSRRGEFTVNIALIRHAAPALGVVYAPATGAAVRRRCRRRQRAARDARSANPVAARCSPSGSAPCRRPASPPSHRARTARRETDAYLAHYSVAELVAVGSSLKFCLVAAGEADLYPRLGPTMEWDTAAGHAVLVAAGGRVSAPDGAAAALRQAAVSQSLVRGQRCVRAACRSRHERDHDVRTVARI